MRRSPRVLLAWSAALVVALTTARVVGGDLATLHRRASSLGPRRTRRRRRPRSRDRPVAIAARDVRTETALRERDPARGAHRSGARGRARRRRAGAARRGRVRGHRRAGRPHRARRRRPGRRPRRARRPRRTASGRRAARSSTCSPRSIRRVVTVEGAGNAAVVVASGARVLAVDGAGDDASYDDTRRGRHAARHRDRGARDRVRGGVGELTLAIAPPESACCPQAGR